MPQVRFLEVRLFCCGGENVCMHSLCMSVGVYSIVSLHPIKQRHWRVLENWSKAYLETIFFNDLLLHECLLCSYKGSSIPTRVPLISLFSLFSFIILALCQLSTNCGVVWVRCIL